VARVEGESVNALRASPSDDTARMYDDAHRALARALDAMDLERDGDLHDAARVGARLGTLGLYRHLNGDVRGLCTIREKLGYHAPLADAVFAVQGLCMRPLAIAKRDDVVAKMVAGERIGGFALTEPEAGSDVASMRATARKEGSHWILDGEKTFISNVGIAHHFVVFAKLDPAEKKSISAFLVPADAQGVELARIPLSGPHPLGRIVLASCRVPEGALLGTAGQGLSLALGTLETFRTSVGAAANGMAWRALDEAIDHTKKRVQFGKPLADLQLVQAAIADMITELHASRWLVASAALHLDSPPAESDARAAHGRRVSMAKMHATECAQRIIDRAVQLHGGSGVVLGSKVEELYREVRPLRIYEGATDVLKLIIAQSMLR